MITLTEAKTLLFLTDTTYDTFINFNIPLVINSICDYCKNHFLNEDIYIISDEVIFANADNSITIADFDSEFVAGDYIRIYESDRNNGYAKIDSIDSTKLVVSGIDIIDETVDINIAIYLSDYPKALKLTASKMLKFLIDNHDPFLKAERIDDYAVTYSDENLVYGFPKKIMSSLDRLYKNVYLKEIHTYDY
jgi:hypothetical protein